MVGDPGRVKFLSYAKFVEGKEVDHGHILSRKQYYCNIGMNSYTKKYQVWKKPLEEAHLEMSLSHCKHSNQILLITGLQTVLRHRELLFREMFHKCWECENFVMFSKKQKVITKAINSLQGANEPNIKVIYGDGSFGSGGSSERSVPVKWFKEATKNRFRDTFEEVDEHRSSKICPKCGIQLYSAVEYFNGKKYDVRGLMWWGYHLSWSPLAPFLLGIYCTFTYLA